MLEEISGLPQNMGMKMISVVMAVLSLLMAVASVARAASQIADKKSPKVAAAAAEAAKSEDQILDDLTVQVVEPPEAVQYETSEPRNDKAAKSSTKSANEALNSQKGS